MLHKTKSRVVCVNAVVGDENAVYTLCYQVSDLSSKLREMRQYWIQLPVALCSKLAAGGNSQDKCWNGITKAR